MLETRYESLLADSLVDAQSDKGFVVTPSYIYSAIIHLLKKFSHGYDELCGFRLLNTSDKLLQHLHFFYHLPFVLPKHFNSFLIIFNSGIVSGSFCAGTLTPVPKKGKCCSYRPKTVSSFLCKILELLLIQDVNKACSTPDNQSGFKKGNSRKHVHYVLANVLMDIDSSGEFLVLVAHDVSHAIDSIDSHLLYSVQQQGLNRSVVRVFRHLYARLCVVVKVPTGHCQCTSQCIRQTYFILNEFT